MLQRKRKNDPSIGSYQSGRVYRESIISGAVRKSIEYEGPLKNPIILVHGFLGSHLKNSATGKDVWGSFEGIDAIRGYSHRELRDISLPMGYGKDLTDLKDNIIPTEFLNTFDVNFFGLHFKRDAYDKLLGILADVGYCLEGKPLLKGKKYHNLFTFFYDWRRDLPENAEKLYKFVLEKKKYLQEKYEELYNIKDYDVHFDFIGHSMGGLLSRYFLRYGTQDLPKDGSLPNLDWFGSNFIDKLFIIGTPNSGYLDTCIELISGLQIAHHAPYYPPAVVGTFHTYYQMLPYQKVKQIVYEDNPKEAVDIFDPQVWIDLKWGLADPEQDRYLQILLPDVKTKTERRKIAIDHLSKCLKRAKQLKNAMQKHCEGRDSISPYLFLGDAVKTRRTLTVNRKTGEIKVSEYAAGDGKVLAASARMDEPVYVTRRLPYIKSPIKWDAVIHLRAAHMGITAGNGFRHNLLYYLLVVPPKDYEKRVEALKQANINI